MSNLEKQISKIKKSYFSFNDLRKIARLDDASLRVAVSRMVKGGSLNALTKGFYTTDKGRADLPKLALEIYGPSYLSFEWVLSRYGILSQKSYALTLATSKRARQIELGGTVADYHHLREGLFFGYEMRDEFLIAEPEKAFLDLAYLSLNGYARFDAGEMSLGNLDEKKVKNYLKRFRRGSLSRLVNKLSFAEK